VDDAERVGLAQREQDLSNDLQHRLKAQAPLDGAAHGDPGDELHRYI
jgi:hypothetical protein